MDPIMTDIGSMSMLAESASIRAVSRKLYSKSIHTVSKIIHRSGLRKANLTLLNSVIVHFHASDMIKQIPSLHSHLS